MSKLKCFLALIILIFASTVYSFSQSNDGVEVLTRISSDELSKRCKKLELGTIVFFRSPDFPAQAPIKDSGEVVNVTVTIDNIGVFMGIVSVDGKSPFMEEAIKAAQKVKFTPTICDGEAISVPAVMTYRFSPTTTEKDFFVAKQIDEYQDISSKSVYYEPIFQLTETYGISFSSSENKFSEEAFLTRGEFSHFLRLTLDYLFEQARIAKKDPASINLIRSYNPNNLRDVRNISGIGGNKLSNESALILVNKYKIALVDENLEFKSGQYIRRNQVIEVWSSIFGNEASPVNFEKNDAENLLISRGEFALFLTESLRVLTYKVLP